MSIATFLKTVNTLVGLVLVMIARKTVMQLNLYTFIHIKNTVVKLHDGDLHTVGWDEGP